MGRRAESGQIPPPVIPAFSRARTSEKVGPLPIINRILEQPRVEELPDEYLPLEDKRVKVPAARSLRVRLGNLLIPRWPWCGMGERAAGWCMRLGGKRKRLPNGENPLGP